MACVWTGWTNGKLNRQSRASTCKSHGGVLNCESYYLVRIDMSSQCIYDGVVHCEMNNGVQWSILYTHTFSSISGHVIYICKHCKYVMWQALILLRLASRLADIKSCRKKNISLFLPSKTETRGQYAFFHQCSWKLVIHTYMDNN